MFNRKSPYEVKKVYPRGSESPEGFYFLFYRGKLLPYQTGLILTENGRNGFTTVTVTFELIGDVYDQG